MKQYICSGCKRTIDPRHYGHVLVVDETRGIYLHESITCEERFKSELGLETLPTSTKRVLFSDLEKRAQQPA